MSWAPNSHAWGAAQGHSIGPVGGQGAFFEGLGDAFALTQVPLNSEHFGVSPDMTILGKALGGTAMPVAAVLADGRLDTAPELNLGYFTHEKNPLMARAGLITLDIIQKQDLAASATTLGSEVLQRLSEIQKRHASIVTAVRGEGLMLSLDLTTEGGDAAGAEHLAQYLFPLHGKGRDPELSQLRRDPDPFLSAYH